jgi:hypothetical protein
MYKRNGKYYILATHPATAEWTLMASSPFGTYTSKVLANAVTPPSTTGGGNPHQGGLVDTPSGNWYYMGTLLGSRCLVFVLTRRESQRSSITTLAGGCLCSRR